MPIHFTFDAQSGIIRIVGTGIVTNVDREEFLADLMTRPELPDIAQVLVNVSAVENKPTPEDMGGIRAMVKEIRKRFRSRVAIVNPTAGHMGISRMIAVSTSDPDVDVFATEQAALDWLRQ